MVLPWIVGSTVLISFLAFSGVLTLAARGRVSNRALLAMVGFSAGALLGGAFLHLIPKTIQRSTDASIFNVLVGSFIVFFLLERVT